MIFSLGRVLPNGAIMVNNIFNNVFKNEMSGLKNSA